MKSFNILLVVLLIIVSCKTDNLASFGEKISTENAITSKEIASAYKKMQEKDTLVSKFTGEVLEVCQSKGCWMRIALNDEGKEAMVKFKDYGFFVPKDIAGKEVVINGKAFVDEMSVDEQQHYAEDAGKSKEEIAQITMPKKTYRFEADGVLVKN